MKTDSDTSLYYIYSEDRTHELFPHSRSKRQNETVSSNLSTKDLPYSITSEVETHWKWFNVVLYWIHLVSGVIEGDLYIVLVFYFGLFLFRVTLNPELTDGIGSDRTDYLRETIIKLLILPRS